MSWTQIGTIKIEGVEAKTYENGALRAIVSQDPPDARWHISISHPHRYPTWDEIKRSRYELIPDSVFMAMLLPPKSQYVNVHPNCFHLHEWRDNEVIKI